MHALAVAQLLCCLLLLLPPPPLTCTPQLFADSVPSVPVSSSAPQLHQPLSQPQQQQQQQHAVTLSAAPPAALSGGYWTENTLDESVWQTLKRDVVTIGRNLRSVLVPVNWDFHNHTAALHNWDLWGPLVRGDVCVGRHRSCHQCWGQVHGRAGLGGHETAYRGTACLQETAHAAAVCHGCGQFALGWGAPPQSVSYVCLDNSHCTRKATCHPHACPCAFLHAVCALQVFMLSLAITLSVGERKPSDVFAVSGSGSRGAAVVV
jgi:hypothetical protein